MKVIRLQTPSKLRSLLVGGAAFGLGLFFATAGEAQREWVSEDGKYSLKASLLSFNTITGKVTLRKDDSSLVEVPFSKLSTADQAYVDEHAPKSASRQKADGPIKLHGITWQPEIEDALEQANGGAGGDRPVMWFRVLGKLDDGM